MAIYQYFFYHRINACEAIVVLCYICYLNKRMALFGGTFISERNCIHANMNKTCSDNAPDEKLLLFLLKTQTNIFLFANPITKYSAKRREKKRRTNLSTGNFSYTLIPFPTLNVTWISCDALLHFLSVCSQPNLSFSSFFSIPFLLQRWRWRRQRLSSDNPLSWFGCTTWTRRLLVKKIIYTKTGYRSIDRLIYIETLDDFIAS